MMAVWGLVLLVIWPVLILGHVCGRIVRGCSKAGARDAAERCLARRPGRACICSHGDDCECCECPALDDGDADEKSLMER